MILKNYYKMLAALATNSPFKCVTCSGVEQLGPATFASGSPNVGMVLAFGSGNIAMSTYAVCPSITDVRTSYASYGGVLFGDGGAAPTPGDYALAGNIITGLTASATATVTEDDTGVTLSAVHTVINNNTDAVTIREVALMAKAGATTNATYSFLVDRTVLDSPVTIPAGGVGQVTYTIRMNYPTA